MAVVVPEPVREGIAGQFETVRVPLERGEPWLLKKLGG